MLDKVNKSSAINSRIVKLIALEIGKDLKHLTKALRRPPEQTIIDSQGTCFMIAQPFGFEVDFPAESPWARCTS
jgi:hypothetical protein